MSGRIRDGWTTTYGKWLALVTLFEVACTALFAATGLWSTAFTAATVGVLTASLFRTESDALQYRREIEIRDHLLAEEGIRVDRVERNDDGGITVTAVRRMVAQTVVKPPTEDW